MRLIDADRLRDAFFGMPNCYNGFSDTYDKAMIVDMVDEQPTIDAVPVVRCKDCKHNSLKRMSGNTYCDLGMGLSQLYDFCSFGERKDDDSKG